MKKMTVPILGLMMKIILELTERDGSTVEISCPSSDEMSGSNHIVRCRGEWTDWEDGPFFAESLDQALGLALLKYREWKDQNES